MFFWAGARNCASFALADAGGGTRFDAALHLLIQLGAPLHTAAPIDFTSGLLSFPDGLFQYTPPVVWAYEMACFSAFKLSHCVLACPTELATLLLDITGTGGATKAAILSSTTFAASPASRPIFITPTCILP
jgi:hypothetical protein